MITPRLDMILKNVTADSVADIGTDHAYIPIALAKKGVRVTATDVNQGPLKIAEKNIKKEGLNITLFLGSGLSPIEPDTYKEIIIAGMGGDLIKKIISDDSEKAYSARLLLQPMNSQAELRKFLIENGFKIEKEDLAKEGLKIYSLIIATKGNAVLPSSETDLYLPPALYSHPLFPMLLKKNERVFSKQLGGLSRSKSPDFAEINRLKNLLFDIEKLKKDVCI